MITYLLLSILGFLTGMCLLDLHFDYYILHTPSDTDIQNALLYYAHIQKVNAQLNSITISLFCIISIAVLLLLCKVIGTRKSVDMITAGDLGYTLYQFGRNVILVRAELGNSTWEVQKESITTIAKAHCIIMITLVIAFVLQLISLYYINKQDREVLKIEIGREMKAAKTKVK